MPIRIRQEIGSSIQEVAHALLIDPTYNWLPSIDGTVLTRSDLSGGTTLTLRGSDLSRTSAGTFDGTANRIELTIPGEDGIAAEIRLPAISAARLDRLATALDLPTTLQDFRSSKWLKFNDYITPDASQIRGHGGVDILRGDGSGCSLYGGAASDRLVFHPGDQVYNGGPGSDWLLALESGSDLSLDLSTGAGQSGTALFEAINFENVQGTRGQDELLGTGRDNEFWGFSGADSLSGGKGNDVLYGGKGSDLLYGGRGSDVLYGGPGADSAYGGFGGDEIFSGSGQFVGNGGGGSDKLYNSGGDGSRYLGGSGSDEFYDSRHDGTMTGGRGSDEFFFGNEPAVDGTGYDLNSGGSDVITDFNPDRDQITFLGTDPLSVLVQEVSGGTLISYASNEVLVPGPLLTIDDLDFG